ncbi:MAG: 16S rRNA (guanine(966)-N(2))-methyltransferase RsmD [Verrucomicrobia bacterium]|nr:MAG: 16S rRNA (guanine(966)-N(2))-methyltransferase RsmD [Verrucomicrobiota bacterium]
MRIIGGVAAGLLIKVPKGYDVRPTPDLVRQAIFNSLGERVVSARVLDLFSGSGALGLECLSRGASQVTSVERSYRHAEMIRQNLEATGLPADKFELRIQDVLTAVAQFTQIKRQFDLILADPPYGEKNIGRRSTSIAQRLLDTAELAAVLAPGGWLVLGHTKRDTLSVPAIWDEVKILKHGDSWMRFLRKTLSSSCGV